MARKKRDRWDSDVSLEDLVSFFHTDTYGFPQFHHFPGMLFFNAPAGFGSPLNDRGPMGPFPISVYGISDIATFGLSIGQILW